MKPQVLACLWMVSFLDVEHKMQVRSMRLSCLVFGGATAAQTAGWSSEKHLVGGAMPQAGQLQAVFCSSFLGPLICLQLLPIRLKEDPEWLVVQIGDCLTQTANSRSPFSCPSGGGLSSCLPFDSRVAQNWQWRRQPNFSCSSSACLMQK